MNKYVKLTEFGQLETLSNDKALDYLDEEELNNAGYKEFVPATYDKSKPYKWSYEETDTQIIEHVEEIVPSPEDLLKIAKEQKIVENNKKRDNKLFGGVTYQNILFDSDTDQKVNLSEQVKKMSDSDTVTWYGMDGGSLLCTKADLEAIGDLIYDLTAFVWYTNDLIKNQVAQAETVEEVEAIEINYENE